MYKMTILFRNPKDITKFEDEWANSFVPFAEKMPGVRRIEVSHVMGGPTGPTDIYKLHEFYFDDRAALDKALTSEKGVRAGQALMTFAPDLTTIIFADVLEEDRDKLQSIAPSRTELEEAVEESKKSATKKKSMAKKKAVAKKKTAAKKSATKKKSTAKKKAVAKKKTAAKKSATKKKSTANKKAAAKKKATAKKKVATKTKK